MSDEYTSNTNQKDFKGSLVDNSFKKEHTKTEYEGNAPYDGDTTSEGGYGGDPFSREMQSPQEKGQFSWSDRSAPKQQQPPENDDLDRHAGEGIIPPNEAAGAQATSGGTGAQAKAHHDGSEIGA